MRYGGEQLDDEYWARRGEVFFELQKAAQMKGLDVYANDLRAVHIAGDIYDVMEFCQEWRSEIEELA